MNETNETRQARAAREFAALPLAERAQIRGREWQITTQAAEYILNLEARVTALEAKLAASAK